MTLEPLDDKVVILPDAKAGSLGNIILPDVAEYRPRFGEVVAVGPGRWQVLCEEQTSWRGVVAKTERIERVPMSVKPGDRVAFSHYGTDGIEIDGIEYLVIPEDRILGILPAGVNEADLFEARPRRN